ncbi:MAG: RluA family pseudouridine synthase [Candidatus Gracilibacteria bacterium]|jgi:23S rRNA pseudouridine1911/1915/1917 synthase
MILVKKYTNRKFEFVGERLDRFLVLQLKDLSRSQIQKMIKNKTILVNGELKKTGYVLTKEDVVTVENISLNKNLCLKAEKIEIPVLYEDKDVLVVDKPYGMVVHPVDGGQCMSGTLVNAVLNKIKHKQFGGLRPGIVHRIDKDTSGALVIAKNKKAAEDLIEQFKSRKVQKYYLTLVYGILKHPEGIIESPIARAYVDRKKMRVSNENEGKMAISIYKTLKIFKPEKGRYACSLLEVQIKTGRTHQIRVHMSALGYPVIGDDTYGNKKANRFFEAKFGLKRQFLHAHTLRFISPDTKKEVAIVANLPSDLNKVITQLS